MVTAQSTTTGTSIYRRHEAREVRPFADAGNYLRDTGLRLTTDAQFTSDESVMIDDIDIGVIVPTIRVFAPQPGFEEQVGAKLEQLCLLVSLEDSFLKRTIILLKAPLSSIQGQETFSFAETLEYPISWVAGVQLHVSVILSGDRDAPAGFVSRKGSWVARKTFRIGGSPRSPRFHVEYVDEEWFTRRGLPSATTSYVVVDGDLDGPVEESTDAVSVYVSKSVALALGKNESSPLSKAFTKALYVDIVTAVLAEGLKDHHDGPTPDGFLNVVCTRTARDAGVTEHELIRQGREKGSSAIRAFVQAGAELSRSLIDASRR